MEEMSLLTRRRFVVIPDVVRVPTQWRPVRIISTLRVCSVSEFAPLQQPTAVRSHDGREAERGDASPAHAPGGAQSANKSKGIYPTRRFFMRRVFPPISVKLDNSAQGIWD